MTYRPPNVRMTVPMARRGECEVDGVPTSLSPQEQRLLEILLVRGPAWISTAALIECLWPNPDQEPDTATTIIRVTVNRLREKHIRIAAQYRLGLLRIAQPGDLARHKRRVPEGHRAKRYQTNPPEWFMGAPRGSVAA